MGSRGAVVFRSFSQDKPQKFIKGFSYFDKKTLPSMPLNGHEMSKNTEEREAIKVLVKS